MKPATHKVIDLATGKIYYKGTYEQCEDFILQTAIIAHVTILELSL